MRARVGTLIGCLVMLSAILGCTNMHTWTHPKCSGPKTNPQTAVVGHPYSLDIQVGGKGQIDGVKFDGRLWRADTSFPPEEYGGRTLHGTITLDKQGTAATQGKATFTTAFLDFRLTQQFVGCL